MTINTASFGLALWPGIKSWYGVGYAQYPEEYKELFDTFSSDKNSEEDVSLVGLGLMSVKPEGQPVTYDMMRQGFRTRVVHATYGLGFVITRELLEDNQYKEVGQLRAEALARSVRVTKETNAANVYNRAFSSSYTFGDGKAILVTDHPNVSGGTWANTLSTAADFSQAALEQAWIDISSFTDDRGLPIQAKPMKLIIPKELKWDVDRVLMSPLQSNTAENAINVVKDMFPGGIAMNHYLTDTDAWFIRTNITNGMKYYERRADDFAEDDDFDTDNLKYKATARYSFTVADPKQLYGSPGA